MLVDEVQALHSFTLGGVRDHVMQPPSFVISLFGLSSFSCRYER